MPEVIPTVDAEIAERRLIMKISRSTVLAGTFLISSAWMGVSALAGARDADQAKSQTDHVRANCDGRSAALWNVSYAASDSRVDRGFGTVAADSGRGCPVTSIQ
jgi:hypothetical protein